MIAAGLATLVLLMLPGVADACASCINSAYGDRTYNVAYIGLILTPFVVAVTIGAVFTRCWWTARHREAADPIDSQFNEETT